MTWSRARGVAVLVVALAGLMLAGGCSNSLRREQVQSLRLGVTTSDQIHRRFGDPSSTKSESAAGQSFSHESYSDRTSALGGYEVSGLLVEYRDGRLNGYNYVSSVKEDKTYADVQEFDRVVIGTSTRADVERLLGEPAGRIRLPSTFKDVDEMTKKDANAFEVWCWNECNGLKNYTYYAPEVRFRTIYVVFDRADKVIRKGTSDQSLGRYMPYTYGN